jgi:hypothetical protein
MAGRFHLTKRALVVAGHFVLAMLLLAPILPDLTGSRDAVDGYPGFGLLIFGGLALAAATAGACYGLGLPPLTVAIDAALVLIAVPWFGRAAVDRSGPHGILSVDLLLSGAIFGLAVIGLAAGSFDCVRWVRRKVARATGST